MPKAVHRLTDRRTGSKAPTTAGSAFTHAYPSYPVWFARVLWATIRREIAELGHFRTAMLVRALTFVMGGVSLYFFSRFVGAGSNQHLNRYGTSYLAFGIVGLIAMDLQHVGVSVFGQRVRMAQIMGYLEAQLATPAPAWLLLAGSPIYDFGIAALRSAVYLVGAAVVFHVRFARVHPASLLMVSVVILLVFLGLGMLTGAATLVARRANPVAAILGALSLLLSGVLYPVSVLPGWLHSASSLLPLTHALEALRQTLLLGASPSELAPSLVPLALFALVLAPAGLGLFAAGLRRARIDGSLTRY
jgi:ABC-2 type transport system permease protein